MARLLKRRVLTAYVIAACLGPSFGFQNVTNTNSVVGEYVRLRLEYDPTLAYAIGQTPSDNMHLPDRSPAALKHLRSKEDRLLEELRTMRGHTGVRFDPEYFVLLEELESRRALRVCRAEYWDLSQTLGWQIELPALTATLPAKKPADRTRLLSLWRTLPRYLSADVDN